LQKYKIGRFFHVGNARFYFVPFPPSFPASAQDILPPATDSTSFPPFIHLRLLSLRHSLACKAHPFRNFFRTFTLHLLKTAEKRREVFRKFVQKNFFFVQKRKALPRDVSHLPGNASAISAGTF
jgi:hypothetical protein